MMKRLIPYIIITTILLFLTGCEFSTNTDVIHTVTFYDGFGSSFTVPVKDGSKLAEPTSTPSAPEGSMKGKFKAWVIKNGDEEKEYDFENTTVRNDFSLYATYSEGYLVSFYDGNSSEPFLTLTVSAGEKVERPEDPEKEGKGNLKAWVKDKYDAENTVYSFDTPVTSSFPLFADYYDLKTVTLIDESGKEIGRKSVSYNSTLDLSDIKRSGDKLIKSWLSEDGTEYDFTSPVLFDMTLKASFYPAVKEKSSEHTALLSALRLSEALTSLIEEGTEFSNLTLAEIFLSSLLKNIDSDTYFLYYMIGDTKCYLYTEEINPYIYTDLLYYEINNVKYSSLVMKETEEEKSLKATDLSLTITLRKGKYDEETSSVVKDTSSQSSGEITLLLESIDFSMKSSGDITLKFVSSSASKTVFSSTIISSENTTDLLLKGGGFFENDSNEYAAAVSFSTVTFSPENGEESIVRKVLTGRSVSPITYIPAPEDASGYGLFREWTKDGVKYDFEDTVEENTTLTASYWTDGEVKRILTAECIYNISKDITAFKTVTGEDTNPNDFPNDMSNNERTLAEVLLCSLLNMEKDGTLYFTDESGGRVPYTDNIQVYILTEYTSIAFSKNNSKRDGDTYNLDFKDFSIGIQFKRKDSATRTSNNVKISSLKATVTATETDSIIQIGDTTYPEVKTSKVTVYGKTMTKFEYDGLTFYREI